MKLSKAKVEYYQDKKKEWRWRIVHDNGNILADSGEGYSSEAAMWNGFNSVRKNILFAKKKLV